MKILLTFDPWLQTSKVMRGSSLEPLFCVLINDIFSTGNLTLSEEFKELEAKNSPVGLWEWGLS